MNEGTEKTKIHFHGGAGSVTGANFLLEIAGKRILIDCGMQQGSEEAMLENYEDFPYDPASIDILFVTHAHADHIGRIPKLVKDGFAGLIYSTEPTRRIAELMFYDNVRLLERDVEKNPLIDVPMYDEKDIQKAMALWQVQDYHHRLTPADGLDVLLYDAGHILGSAMVKFSYRGKNIVFTGDLGNSPAPLLRDTEVIHDADYLIMESVYGSRNHEERSLRSQKLEQALRSTIHAGGVVMIPAFSVERTQELLYEMNRLIEEGHIPEVPVYLDSPLAIRVTEVYRDGVKYFNKETQDRIASGDDVFDFPGFVMTPDREDSKAINVSESPKVIIAGSGMSHGGRIIHHEMRYLSDPNNTLIFIGYQAAGTLGRIIQDGARKVTIYKDEVPVRAKIVTISGYSGHKQRDDLMQFVHDTKDRLKTVWCVMGEPDSSMFLAQRLRDYVGVKAVVPEKGDVVEIEI